MSLFGLEKVTDVQADKDTLGGFQAKPSGVYPCTIDHLFVKQAGSGAKALSLIGTVDGAPYSEDFYFTSGTAKGGKHYTENNGVKRYLPGFNMADAMLNMLIGKGLFDMTEDDIETAVVKQRGKDGKDEPTEVPAVAGVKGKVIQLGIQRVIQNGRKNVGTQDKAKWVTTNDKRTQNQTDRIFNEDGFTINELRAEAEAPAFIEEWKEKWEGNDNDRFKAVDAAAAGGSAGGADAAKAKSAGGKSLFGN